jgi:hypothetical protein
MKPVTWSPVACVALLLTATTAIASDPIGIYAIVERVVLEPNDAAPERIQISGVFALAQRNHPDDYRAPERGTLYYSLPGAKAQQNSALAEWADLKKIAGGGQAIGFGSRYIAAGSVRKAGEALKDPDVYPVQMGIVKLTDQGTRADIVRQLKEGLKAR